MNHADYIKLAEGRRWRTCMFCPIKTRKPDGRQFIFMVSPWGDRTAALDNLWDYRSVVKGQWWSWTEPESMTDDERRYWVPRDAREYAETNRIYLWREEVAV